MLKLNRPDAVKAVAPVTASFVVWAIVASGLLFTVATASPETLKPIPTKLIAYFPRVLVAGALLIAGNVGGTLIALAVGRAMLKATGARRPSVERLAKALPVALTAVIAVAQLGVNTTVVNLVLAAVVFGLAASSALLVGLGGRDVARHLAAGRYTRTLVRAGDTVVADGLRGMVNAVHAASLEISADDGAVLHVPHGQLLDQILRVQRGASRPDGPQTGAIDPT